VRFIRPPLDDFALHVFILSRRSESAAWIWSRSPLSFLHQMPLLQFAESDSPLRRTQSCVQSSLTPLLFLDFLQTEWCEFLQSLWAQTLGQSLNFSRPISAQYCDNRHWKEQKAERLVTSFILEYVRMNKLMQLLSIFRRHINRNIADSDHCQYIGKNKED
jgi:hypothetical protein